jgi:hypothetical protein
MSQSDRLLEVDRAKSRSQETQQEAEWRVLTPVMDVAPLRSDPKPRLFHLTFSFSFFLLMKRVEGMEGVERVDGRLSRSTFQNGLQIIPSTTLHTPQTLHPSFRASTLLSCSNRPDQECPISPDRSGGTMLHELRPKAGRSSRCRLMHGTSCKWCRCFLRLKGSYGG